MGGTLIVLGTIICFYGLVNLFLEYRYRVKTLTLVKKEKKNGKV